MTCASHGTGEWGAVGGLQRDPSLQGWETRRLKQKLSGSQPADGVWTLGPTDPDQILFGDLTALSGWPKLKTSGEITQL